jgi:hypothetical protein
MKQLRSPRILSLLLPALLAVLLLPGCAAKKNVWGDPASGVTLSYRLPEERVLRYETVIDQSQDMEVMGRTRDLGYGRTIGFSVTSEGASEEGQQLAISIDSMTVRLDSPRGKVQREIREVLGKSFELVLSPAGEELSLSGADAIGYDLPTGVRQSVEADFQALFPDLPATPVVAGDTWTSRERIINEALGSPVPIELHYVNTVDGFEVVDGKNCVKVSSRMNAELADRVETPDDAPRPYLPFRGGIVGTAVSYFAYEEGILVRKSVTLRAAGTLSTGGINPMPRRLTQMTTIEMRLLQ